MICPKCGANTKATVLETRTDNDGNVFRRRACGSCGKTFATQEVAATHIPETRQRNRRVDRRTVQYDFGPLSGAMR